MKIKEIFEKTKAKWGITSNWQFFLINVVFALAGMMIVHVRVPIFVFLGITPETALWIKIAIYIPLVLPIYQINLLLFGFLLGQFDFFWAKEKALFTHVQKLFLKVHTTSSK